MPSPPTKTTLKQEAALRKWGEHFLPYQREFLSAPERIALWVKARQIGFSHVVAGDAVKEAILHGTTNIIISASQPLSDEVLVKAAGHARALREAGFTSATLIGQSSRRISFKNGGRVISLPSNPRTARSYTGNIYLDEFAYHEDPQGIWDGAGAMAMRKERKIRLISTPNGAQGLHYEWATSPPKGWGVRYVTAKQAIAQGMPVNIASLWELAAGDERVFAQLFMCSFLDAHMQYIPTAMADRALGWIGVLPQLNHPEVTLHAGLDIGRTNDLTVLTVIAVCRGKAYVVASMTCKRTKFRAQRAMIREAREILPWATLHIDRTGLGMDMAEELVEQWGEHEVFPVDFTQQSKADMATRSLRWLRDDRLKLSRGAEGKLQHKEICSVKRIVTNAGNVTFDVTRTKEGHGDRWWSICLALKGAGEPEAPRGVGQEPMLAFA